MTADHPNAEFTDVDRAADPQAYVTMLDRQHARASTQAYKRRALALLDPQPGQRILDVGCGVGVDTLALARLVGPAGQVVGLDYSQTMVDEARRRSQGTPLPVNFEQGDVQRLAYPDATFDRCYADRVFQHLPDPLLALTELRRVLKLGGALVIVDPDHETRVIDTPYPDVTRRFLNFRSDTFQQGGIAHRLYALFHELELTDVAVEPVTEITTDYHALNQIMTFDGGMRVAQAQGVVTQDEADRWITYVEDAARLGRFFHSITYFITMGHKPMTHK